MALLQVSGEAIKNARLIRGLRQQDLAERAGIAPQTLCNIEKGQRRPSNPIAARIAAALDVTIESLCVPVADNAETTAGAA